MHIATIMNINKTLNSFFYFIQTNLLKTKTNLGRVKYLFVRVFYWGGLLDAVLNFIWPPIQSLSSTTGISLSANNFLTGSGIFLSPETVELMLSRLRDLGLPTIAETHWRENTVHGG